MLFKTDKRTGANVPVNGSEDDQDSSLVDDGHNRPPLAQYPDKPVMSPAGEDGLAADENQTEAFIRAATQSHVRFGTGGEGVAVNSQPRRRN
jgi:hypothetical protein